MKLYVEKFEDDNWIKLDDLFKDPFLEQYTDQPFSWPKLELYSILADVENRFGITPIDTPRGIPSDVSDAVSSLYFSSEHNVFPSSISLKEFLDYNFYKTFDTTAYISLFDYPEYLTKGYPDHWYNSIQIIDKNLTKLIDCELANVLYNLNIIEPIKKLSKKYEEISSCFPTFYVQITWNDSLINRLGVDFFDMLDQIKLLSDSKDFSDIRFVFWFVKGL